MPFPFSRRRLLDLLWLVLESTISADPDRRGSTHDCRSSPNRIHAGGTAGRHRDHRDPRQAALSRRAARPGGSQSSLLHEQPASDRRRDAQSSRRVRIPADGGRQLRDPANLERQRAGRCPDAGMGLGLPEFFLTSTRRTSGPTPRTWSSPARRSRSALLPDAPSSRRLAAHRSVGDVSASRHLAQHGGLRRQCGDSPPSENGDGAERLRRRISSRRHAMRAGASSSPNNVITLRDDITADDALDHDPGRRKASQPSHS